MGEIWRVLDTGLRSAAHNIALDRALLEARKAGEISSTLRFLRFTRCALLGLEQSAAQELDPDYCRRHDIDIQRRVSGGPAQFVDDAQLAWTLYLHKREVQSADARAISKRLCHAAATAMSAFGIDARCKRGDEIEVDGRTLGSCGITFDGDALLFHGTLAIDGNADERVRVLRVPGGRADAAERAADFNALLGRRPDVRAIKHNIVEAFESELDVEFRDADLTLTEEARYHAALREIDTPDWVNLVSRPASEAPVVHSACSIAGGVLRASLAYDTRRQKIKQVWFTGDIVTDPRRTVADLEAELRDVALEHLARKVEWFFASRPVRMHSLAADDFVNAVRRALKQPVLIQNP